jgi:hypothetical protein
LGIFFFVIFFAIKSFVWLLILKKRGFEPQPRKVLFEYSYSEAKRYIPGSIFAIAGRMNAHSKSVPQKETLKGIGIEVILLTLSAIIMSLPAIFYLVFKTNQIAIPHFVFAFIAGAILITSCILVIVKKMHTTILGYFNQFLLYLLAWLT